MLFTELNFIIAFLALLVILDLTPKRVHPRFLILASFGFYGYWSLPFSAFMFVGLSSIYFLSRLRFRVVGLVILSLSFLIWFKYKNWLLSLLLGTENVPMIVPLGLSFIVFQVVDFLLNYRNNDGVSYEKFLFYIMFFPQLIAGPIERYSHMASQYSDYGKQGNSRTERLKGLSLFIQGFFQKSVLADGLGVLVDDSWDKLLSKAEGLAVLLAYASQIYLDFSGYSLMAIGLAAMLGFNLTVNFNYPYLTWGIGEFWKNWHITLNKWFVSNVYIPLGGSQGVAIRTHRNILVVFLLSGLWHGANVNFLIWGLLNGVGLLVERIYLKSRLARVLWMIMIVLLSWIFFRSATVDEAWSYILNLCSNRPHYGLGIYSYVITGLSITYILLEPKVAFLRDKNPITFVLFGILVSYLFYTESNSFIYFQF